MRILFLFFVVTAFVSSCSTTSKDGDTSGSDSQVVDPAENDVHVIAEQALPDTLKGSLKAKAMGSVGNVGITINYYSPAVRARIVWGGLVPFDNVWVTGAHRATTIEFDQEVELGGVTVDPGKYGFFTIPGKDEWTLIINKTWDQHLADDYDPKDDVARVKIKPEVQEVTQERLRYVVDTETDSTGEVVMYWEKLEISLPIKIKS